MVNQMCRDAVAVHICFYRSNATAGIRWLASPLLKGLRFPNRSQPVCVARFVGSFVDLMPDMA
ncbi:hypothetical protein LMG28140_00770 [Paraburkholderia metrosideri]|uniref:Transposase n=1 Tax=Paraburkholderia metrosideri TaxID=580937 RepID=A0ABN7HFU5_9BURK|nr:hypothetical protein LMG28140_00770 [Paraburkholderia metrosideri]